jgi:hypothetical protein
VFGFAIRMAQRGEKHPDAKPLKGLVVRAFWRSSRTSMGTHTGRPIR